jgi:glycerol-3-phosphate dehydrogenase
MKRKLMLKRLSEDKLWDVVIIGGGATGLGAAVEAATRGYEVLLLEQSDFAKGTSSRSTKLVHGGVRYLAQGDISLVLEALNERGLLRQNAPHLVKNQAFIIPNYEWWDGPFYTIGMKVYDMMAGKLGLGPSESISKEETIAAIPNIRQEGLRGGVIYHDGQFDDARLAISLAQTAHKNNGTLLNYFRVDRLTKNADGLINGLSATDTLTGQPHVIRAKSVVNATGVFVDDILKTDNPDAKKDTRFSQGVHVVLDADFLQGRSAIMIPKTDDGRVLFAVPWHGKVIVGTTDTPVEQASLEPRALQQEIDFILNTAGRYLTRSPKRADVLSIFAGLRPLAITDEDGSQTTKEVSRNHKIMVSLSGLVTVTGGKWTTYRKMGEDIIDKVTLVAGLDERPSITRTMPIHGYVKNFDETDPLHIYGSDRLAILNLVDERPRLGALIHPRLPYIQAEVVWAVKHEMACTVEDVLSRRTRALLLDARASLEAAPLVAQLMAKELKQNDGWQKDQVQQYRDLAQGYLLE